MASWVRVPMTSGNTAGGLVDSQSKLDLVAGGAILLMLLGAFMLTISSLGLIMIAGAAILMLFLFLKILRTNQ